MTFSSAAWGRRRKIFGGVSDERQLEIRRKRKKIQEKLSNGEKNVIS